MEGSTPQAGWAARRKKQSRSKRTMTGPANGAVIYARVSSKEQEEGFSIGAQLDLLRRYAAEKGIEVVHEFVDVETARKAGRTHFGEMVRFIRSSLAPVTILVEKTDRIYRNLKDYTTLDELVRERDTRIHLVKENEVLGREASSHTKFIHGIKVLMAKNYVDNLSEEVTKGQMKKAESGQYPSIPPVGYRWDRQKRSLAHVEEEAAHVRRAFKRYATGLYSLEKVAELGRDDGFATRKGAKISKHGIEGIIKNPIYYGDFYWRGRLYKGAFEGIVSRELWEEANRQLRRTARPESYTKRELPYRGLAVCERCGSAVTTQVQKKRFVYLHCCQPTSKCKREYLRKEDFEKQLFEGIERIQIPDDMALILREVLEQVDRERERTGDGAEQLTAKAAELKSRLDRLYTDRLENRIDEQFFTDKWNAWRSELSQIETQIARAGDTGADARKHFENAIELANRAKSLFETGNESFRTKLVQITLSNLSLDGKSLRYDYRFPFNLFVKTGGEGEWRRGWDSNPRCLSARRFSRPVPSTTRPPLRGRACNLSRRRGGRLRVQEFRDLREGESLERVDHRVGLTEAVGKGVSHPEAAQPRGLGRGYPGGRVLDGAAALRRDAQLAAIV